MKTLNYQPAWLFAIPVLSFALGAAASTAVGIASVQVENRVVIEPTRISSVWYALLQRERARPLDDQVLDMMRISGEPGAAFSVFINGRFFFPSTRHPASAMALNSSGLYLLNLGVEETSVTNVSQTTDIDSFVITVVY